MKCYDTHGRHLQDFLNQERSHHPSPGALGYMWRTIASMLARQAQRELQSNLPYYHVDLGHQTRVACLS